MKAFPPEYDDRLWFTLDHECAGRHYVLGSATTFPGRIMGWCEARQCSFFFSKGELLECSEFTAVWIRGFLAGSVPCKPEEVDESEWEAQVLRFFETGDWSDERQRLTALSDDIELARRGGVQFRVMERAGRHQPWTPVSGTSEDLEAALSIAAAHHAWRVGVLTLDGFIYWTSDVPDVRNSSILQRMTGQLRLGDSKRNEDPRPNPLGGSRKRS